ncbi:MAG: prepilin-type N-terminal cleavage/methylation domain-containing protein [Candidatus Harrisonbacteria bacterium]|nr:prepilin-type N-terminal cleavage/methylation domain-containing protein [Candidatus Harrisonbacteria bacterium]
MKKNFQKNSLFQLLSVAKRRIFRGNFDFLSEQRAEHTGAKSVSTQRKEKIEINRKRQALAGFTLIELMVATSLFLVVIGTAASIFVQSLRTERAIVALMGANDSVSGAIETMSREIRIGSDFTTAVDGKELHFSSTRSGDITYRFDPETGRIERNGEAMTSSNVEVKKLQFLLQGEEPRDGKSSRVTILISISARDSRISSIETHMQTTVSSRQLDS